MSDNKKVADVVWVVTRVLLHCGKWTGRENVDPRHAFVVTEDGLERNIASGEWIQHPSDGAIGEIVGEFVDQMSANERALKLQRDNPSKEYRICASVAKF